MTTSSTQYPKYFKDTRHLDSVDVYRVLDLFDVQDHALGHCIKKLLLSGVRTGGKTQAQDITEARDTLNRWLEMQVEDDAGTRLATQQEVDWSQAPEGATHCYPDARSGEAKWYKMETGNAGSAWVRGQWVYFTLIEWSRLESLLIPRPTHDWDAAESRMDIVGSNGNNGEHYPDADGWIENTGVMPVELGTPVDVKHRDGSTYLKRMAGQPVSFAYDWSLDNSAFDITHYRLSQ